jgi:hypothetical protein
MRFQLIPEGGDRPVFTTDDEELAINRYEDYNSVGSGRMYYVYDTETMSIIAGIMA